MAYVNIFNFYHFVWGGLRLDESLGTVGTYGPAVPAPDDRCMNMKDW